MCDWVWGNKDDYEDISVVDWACSVAALSETGEMTAILNSAEWPEGYTPTAKDWVKFTKDAIYDATGSILKEASPPYESPDGVPTGADPVFVSNGEYGTSVTDIVVPGRGISIGITRTYGGRREYNGRFGYGWDMNYNMKIRRLSGDDDTVILLDGKGYRREYVFDSSTGKYERSSDRSDFIVYDEADDTFALIDKAWTTYTFDVNGNLDSITDRNGNSITFEYDVAKSDIIGPSNYFLGTSQGVPSNDSRVVAREYKLTKIIDTLGRELSLTYNGNGL
ncbi:MAG: hypothetical protein KAS23_14090, partial [Anaerohalosphaera sp.]|nr:hypothetical protein [Anaerohalosphaera sp.]